MEIRLNDSSVLKTIVGASSNLMDEVNLDVSPDKLSIAGMDPSHVAMLSLEAPAADFSSYAVGEEKELGVNLVELERIASRVKKSDAVTIEFGDEDESTLRLTFEGQSTRRFTCPLVEVKSGEMQKPELDLSATVLVKAKAIRGALRDAKLIGDNVRLEVSSDEFTLKNEHDNKSFSVALRPDGEIEDLSVVRGASTQFSIDYLERIVSPAPSSEMLELELGTDLPARVTYPVTENGRAEFILAPRVEAEQ